MTIECFQGQKLRRIGTADHYLLLAPTHGGRLVRWVLRGRDLLYWPDTADWTQPGRIRGGNPLLFPFIGRHFVDAQPGRWRDTDGAVYEMPQHGFARNLPFTVTNLSNSKITMSLGSSRDTLDAYPYAFKFHVTYEVLADSIEATLRVENLGNRPLPWYAGHHFYFAVPHGVRDRCTLKIGAAHRIRQTATGELTSAEPGASSYGLDDARLQDTFHVLHESDKLAQLTLPETANHDAYTITLEDLFPESLRWHAVTTWTEHRDSDFYCVEPWTGLPNAAQHGQGLHWLEAGAGTVCRCRVSISN